MSACYKQKSKEELLKLIDESKTFAEFMRKLGYESHKGASSTYLRNYLKENGIDISKFSKNNIYNFSHPKSELKDVLISGSTYTNLNSLKNRILREGILEYKCDECGITEWNGKPITLQLDHINGDNRDHRIENLRLLCPNCHSQTETYSRKKK